MRQWSHFVVQLPLEFCRLRPIFFEIDDEREYA